MKVLSDLKNAGHEMILVSSGAIGMGVGKLNLPGVDDGQGSQLQQPGHGIFKIPPPVLVVDVLAGEQNLGDRMVVLGEQLGVKGCPAARCKTWPGRRWRSAGRDSTPWGTR